MLIELFLDLKIRLFTSQNSKANTYLYRKHELKIKGNKEYDRC